MGPWTESRCYHLYSYEEFKSYVAEILGRNCKIQRAQIQIHTH